MTIKKNIHFIAVGGSVMHNLAIALKLKGFHVSGSDDEIFEPARTNLLQYDLLPPSIGWDETRIDSSLDSIVLGMHARADNPELLRAKSLGIRIFSFPEFLYEQSKNKKRVVIGGSHGKTTITAMIMHILDRSGKNFDYAIGAAVKGFDLTVRLSDDAPVMILEGDEYPDSALNKTPKFHLYQPHIGLISGIAWDHINVFPTLEGYTNQFRIFAQKIPESGTLIYNSEDPIVSTIANKIENKVRKVKYQTPDYEITNGITYLNFGERKIPMRIFGKHNLQNMMGAVAVCDELGIGKQEALELMVDFTGAARRLEVLSSNSSTAVYKDFAHSPSKLKATIAAVKEQFPIRQLVACMELHTFSSLNKDFLSEYHHTMKEANVKVVFCNNHAFELKRLKPFSADFIRESFADNGVEVFREKETLLTFLKSFEWSNTNLLLMSSGDFGGMELGELTTFVTGR